MNYFSEVLNVRMISDVMKTEIHTAERLVPGPSPYDVEMANEKLKKI
jgi:hypothetical protein